MKDRPCLYYDSANVLRDFTSGEVSELADEHDLGSCAARRRGSSPLFPTFLFESLPFH